MRLSDRLDDALGKRLDVHAAERTAQQDRELISAEPSNKIAIAEKPPDIRRRFDKQGISCRIAQRIVDDLEGVEIDKQQHEGLIPTRVIVTASSTSYEKVVRLPTPVSGS